VYVSATSTGSSLGTRDFPYTGLSQALEELWAPFTVVYLLTGTHYFAHFQGISNPHPFPKISTVWVKTLFCSEDTHPECSLVQANIQLTRLSTQIQILGHLILQNLVFTGNFSLKDGCLSCTYCPALLPGSAPGLWRDDQGLDIDLAKVAEETLCAAYRNQVLIAVETGGKLDIANVTFEHIRHQPKAIISSNCSDITLHNVTFTDLIPAKSVGAVLLYEGVNGCGAVNYSLGSVALLRNGYELKGNAEFGGLMRLNGVGNFTIDLVEFEGNFQPQDLVICQNCKKVEITNCRFRTNILWKTAISLANVNSVRISGCWFQQNTAYSSIVDINLDTGLAFISNSTFSRNIAVSSLLRINSHTHNSASVTLLSAIFQGNVCPTSLLISEIAAVSLSSSHFVESGDLAIAEVERIPIQAFLDFPYIYASQPILPFTMDICEGVVQVLNSDDISVTFSQFQDNYCSNGPPGLKVLRNSNTNAGILTVDSVVFQGNDGPGVLSISGNYKAVLDNLACEGNSNLRTLGPACVYIDGDGLAVYDIRNSNFSGNIAQYSTSIEVSNTLNISLSALTVQSNRALAVSAGLTFHPLNALSSHFRVSNSLFQYNSANSTGVLLITYLNNKPQLVNKPLYVTVSLCRFLGNKATHKGAGISILSFMQLSEESVIEDCQFSSNESGVGGGLFVEIMVGKLTVQRSSFTGNSGTEGAGIYYFYHGVEDTGALIDIRQCSFVNNTGTGALFADGMAAPRLVTSACVFQGNQGSGVVLHSATWNDSNSQYTGNTGKTGGACLAYNSNVSLSGCVFTSNTATQRGGAVTLLQASRLLASNSAFRSNKCSGQGGGAVFVEQDSLFQAANTTFLSNQVSEKGSAIYIHRSTVVLIFSNFSLNAAGQFGAIFLSSATVNLTGCDLSFNTAVSRGPGICATLGRVNVWTSSFHDQIGVNGGALFGVDQTVAVVDTSSFRNCTANSGGAFVINAQSSLTLRRSVVSHCSAKTDGGMVSARVATITLDSTNVSNIVSTQEYGALCVFESTMTVINSRFFNLTNSAMYGSTSTANVRGSVFESITAFFGGVLYCAGCLAANFQDSNVTGLSGRRGGVVYAYTSGLAKPASISLFQGNTFTNNSAIDGGALYFFNMFVVISQNVFIGNRAGNQTIAGNAGSGGAVFFSCPSFLQCTLNLTYNTFEGNSALVSGGAVQWLDSFPFLEGNKMKGNEAVYGNDIASFPVKVALLDGNNSVQPYQEINNYPILTDLKNIASGWTYTDVIKAALVDHYGNIVTTDSISTAFLISANSSSLAISGETSKACIHGVFRFSNFSIEAAPGSSQTLLISTAAVALDQKGFIGDPTPYYPIVGVNLKLRECVSGESYLQGVCYPCPESTFSLDPSNPCLSCPSEAICLGTNQMTPRAGYWRPDSTLDLFFQCTNKDACLGSPDPESLSLTGECAPGYHGNLCSVCDADRSFGTGAVCNLCPGFGTNITLMAFLGFFLIVAFGVFVAISIRGANLPRSELAIYVKILVNYLQLVTVASALNLNWPSYVSLFLQGQQTVGSASEQILSIECLLKSFSSQEIYYTNLKVYLIAPLVIIAGASVIWLLIGLFTKSQSIRQKIVGSTVLLIFVLHTSLTKLTFSIFNCREILPTELWLVTDLSIKCWDSKHISNMLQLALPGLIVWVIGLPTLCLLLLIRSKRFLADPNVRLQFSFLYKGYKSEWYFWEFVILYRKIGVVSISVFLSTVSVTVQALSMLAVVLICFFLQLFIKPFNATSFNSLELKALLASFLTIYAGLYFDTKSVCNFHTDSELNYVLFVIILLSNGYFLFEWARLVLPALLGTLKKRLLQLKSRAQESASVVPERSFDASSLHLSLEVQASASVTPSRTPIQAPSNTPDLSLNLSL